MSAAGRLRRRIVLMRKTTTEKPRGGFETVWAPVGDPMPAEVIGINGRESVIGEALQGISFYRIIVRYCGDVRDDDQIIYDGKTLNIRSATDPDDRRRWLLILADTGSAQKTT